MTARRRNLIVLGAVAAVAVVIVAVAIGVSRSGGNSGGSVKKQSSQASALMAGIPQHGTVIGRPNAPYTLVEFADLQCPFCREYTLNILPTVIRQYVRTGRIKMDLKIRAFLGADSVTAAHVAAGAAQQSRLWPFADVFYHQQGEENSGYVTPAFLRRIAEATPGLNANRALAAANTQAANEFVNRNETLANAIKSTGTPDFFIRRGGGPFEHLNADTSTPQAFTQALAQAISGQ